MMKIYISVLCIKHMASSAGRIGSRSTPGSRCKAAETSSLSGWEQPMGALILPEFWNGVKLKLN